MIGLLTLLATQAAVAEPFVVDDVSIKGLSAISCDFAPSGAISAANILIVYDKNLGIAALEESDRFKVIDPGNLLSGSRFSRIRLKSTIMSLSPSTKGAKGFLANIRAGSIAKAMIMNAGGLGSRFGDCKMYANAETFMFRVR